MWGYIKELIVETVKHHVPTRRSSAKHTHPWMTSELRSLSIRKQKAHTRARCSKDPRDVKRFKTLKGQLQRESRRVNRAYLEDVVKDDLRTIPKQFWSYIKTRKQDSFQIVTLKSKDGFLHNDTAIKATIRNEQFQSVYTRQDLSALPDLGPSPYPTMSNITIHENGVLKLLKGLRPFKAKGTDEISAFILKHSAESLALYLTRMYHLSLDQGQKPDKWRRENIVPIYKKGKKHQPSNYRPVSLTSIACKLLEHAVYTVQLWITSIGTTSCVMSIMASEPADHVRPNW